MPGCSTGSAGPRPRCSRRRRQEAEALFRRIGITFAVYGEGGDTERLIPFDMMPRVFTEAEWRKLERGVKQRARALNAFLWDVYHRAEIVRAGVIPADLVFRNEAYEPAVVGDRPAGAGLFATSSASTWCAPGPRTSSCSRTTAARRRGSPTCWRTARS